MGITMVLSLLSGVALFLYGMSLMGDSLKKVAGNKLELILYRLTNTPLKGLLLGTVVTAIIQSSSATTVMVVGFVNSGMMKVAQAIGIIMGANIGTSITGWILCLSYIDGSSGIAQLLSTATISAIVAIIGIIFRTFIKKKPYSDIGDIMLGFAILMIGMQTMSGAVSPLKENPHFVRLLTMFTNPFMGILVGIVFTAVLQSASASVGILQALSITGSITFAAALPITMGIGVGAACPVLLSSIGTNKNGKRTALIYLLNDLFGMIIWSILFYGSNVFMQYSFVNKVMSPVNIALMNTAIRCGNVLVLFWFIPQIEKLLMRIVKDSPEDLAEQADFDLLEERLIPYPALAIAQCHRVMNGMAKKVRNNVNRSMNLINEFKPEKYDKVHRKENLIDKYEARLGSYLMQLTKQALNTEQTRQASLYLHTISDFERIGDHAADIAEMSKSINENRMEMSEAAMDELNLVMEAVRESMNMTYHAYLEDDLALARRVSPLGIVIRGLCDEMKLRHVERLSQGNCGLEEGTVFNDLLNSLNRIATHCASSMVALIKIREKDTDIHIHDSKVYAIEGDDYKTTLAEYREKYDLGQREGRIVSMEDEQVE
mgnify:CR=1 FL=1